MRSALLALAVSTLLVACKPDPSAGGSSAAGDSKASSRKLKTTLTSKQLEEAWATLKGNHDFKKHSEVMTAKLGAAQQVEGDRSCWFGYQPAAGPVPDDCMQLCTSATKGSGTQTTDGAGKCWN